MPVNAIENKQDQVLSLRTNFQFIFFLTIIKQKAFLVSYSEISHYRSDKKSRHLSSMLLINVYRLAQILNLKTFACEGGSGRA